MSLPLLGLFSVRYQGTIRTSHMQGLKIAGVKVMELAPKEDFGSVEWFTGFCSPCDNCNPLCDTSTILNINLSRSLSVDAAMGSDAPFDDRIHQVHKDIRAQRDVSTLYWELLDGNGISRIAFVSVYEFKIPTPFAAKPQIMGAVLHPIGTSAGEAPQIEANAIYR